MMPCKKEYLNPHRFISCIERHPPPLSFAVSLIWSCCIPSFFLLFDRYFFCYSWKKGTKLRNLWISFWPVLYCDLLVFKILWLSLKLISVGNFFGCQWQGWYYELVHKDFEVIRKTFSAERKWGGKVALVAYALTLHCYNFNVNFLYRWWSG